MFLALNVSSKPSLYRTDASGTSIYHIYTINFQNNNPYCQFFNIAGIRLLCKFSFLQITQKVKVLELKVVLSADINMHFPVSLS